MTLQGTTGIVYEDNAGVVQTVSEAKPLPTGGGLPADAAKASNQTNGSQLTGLNADARTAALASLEITLSATPGIVTVVTLPDTVRGFRLYPRSNNCRFAVGEIPTVVATVAAGTQAVAAATLAASIGGIAKADAWEVRLLDAGTARTLQLKSLTASHVVDLETF